MNLKIVIFFVAVSLFLSFVWLPAGQIVGGGDVGMPTFLPQRSLKVVSYSWWETQATGTTNPATFTAVPFYLILSVLDKIGFGPDLTQRGFFMLILAGGAVSIYFLAKEFEFGQKSSFLAGFFYIFNLGALSVWHRGVHNAMLMLLLMPLSLLLIARGVRDKKYLSILWVNIVSILASYVYGTPAYIIAIWLLWLTFLLVELYLSFHEPKERKFIITYIFVLFLSWIGLNAWWLLHFLENSRQFVGQFSAAELHQRSSDVVEDLKIYTKPEYVLRGLNAYYHYGNLDWGNFYLSRFAIFISWIPPVVIFSTLLIRKNYQKTYWIFLVSLTAVVIFISKGVNAPLGGLNKLAYDYIPALAVLRNPYEKIGIILIIPFSLLFALGCSQVLQFFNKINKSILKLVIISVVITSAGILVWPMWKGEIFRTAKSKSYFSVPPYYAEANKWFEGQLDDTRILHLPLAPGESVDYDWGYTGVEPSQLLFPGSSIAYSTGSENIDLMSGTLLKLIHNQESVSLEKMLSFLNVGWIVVHNETVWRNRSLEPVDRINAWLKTNPYFLEHTGDFGPLSVWRVKDQYRLGHIFSVNKSTGNIIKPTESMIYSALDAADEKESLNNLAEVKYLPDSIIYPLVIFKENISLFLNQNDSIINCLALSGKRLKEAALLYRQNKFTETNKSFLNYGHQLDKCSKIRRDIGSLKSTILEQLIKQKAVLDFEFTDVRVASGSEAARVKLREYLSNLGLTSRYDPLNKNNNNQRIIFHYFVSKAGSYNIKLDKPDDDLIKTPPKIVQIDSSALDLTPVEAD
ncbi:MAG: alpha-(1-_3)-arabinofuranosyltransferase family protein, partial [Candidatus Levybacteria bacterium]|nr:alpha-(1->3)-arabinofuranosyltransferase family protein [Candidatus Levybacteria bacterium]